MILYINACVRKNSRTDRIARALLENLGGEYEELYLEGEGLSPLDREKLGKRTELIKNGDYSDPMFEYAKQFAKADTIVISAPYWDLSFPTILKTYIENIYVTGIVTRYSESGTPIGLCRAKKLFYITTAGGKYVPDYSYFYIRDLAENCFGIKETALIKAEKLDIIGVDAEKQVDDVINLLNERKTLYSENPKGIT